MADHTETWRMVPTVDAAGRTAVPYSQTNTTVNVPTRSPSVLVPALAAAVVFAVAGVVAWRVLDDDAGVAPVAQTTAPEGAAPAATEPAPPQPVPEQTPPAVPEGDPAPSTPPAGDPPANPPTAAPGN